jgi:Na+-transporting NADH:ubiquinone oxidoreductase subunit NqrF
MSRCFHFVPTLIRIGPGHVAWKGATGFISAPMPSRHVNNLRAPLYYVARPPDMVSEVQQMLVELGVCKENIQIEHFCWLLKIVQLHGVYD